MDSKCSFCSRQARLNIHGSQKGYCMVCAKAHGLLKPGDHDPTEPDGFAEFWETLNQGAHERMAETV